MFPRARRIRIDSEFLGITFGLLKFLLCSWVCSVQSEEPVSLIIGRGLVEKFAVQKSGNETTRQILFYLS